MNTYELRSALRELIEESMDVDTNNVILPKDLRREIEEKLFELDRVNGMVHNYREVLRNVLS